MKANRVLLVPVLALVVAACSKTEAPPTTTVKADLQPACSREAATWFKNAYGEGSKTLQGVRTVKAAYQVHYNAKLKQCLVRVESDTPAQGAKPAIWNLTLREIDTKDRTSLASVVRVGNKMTYCVVNSKKCASEQEWENLTKPLMLE